jgi:hypothetical protein
VRWSVRSHVAPRFVPARSIVGGRSGTVANGFAQVLIASPEDLAGEAVDRAAGAEPAIEVEFAGRARVRIPASIPAELATAVMKALSR